MGYRRFRLQLDRFDPATVATIATDLTERLKSVADVASVAAVLPLANTILSGYRALLEASARGAVERQIRVVELFLDQHLTTAVRLGWSNEELFGCHSDRAFATVRYDCMGAVTIAALTRSRVADVTGSTIRGENGLATRRPASCLSVKPVWLVFPTRAE